MDRRAVKDSPVPDVTMTVTRDDVTFVDEECVVENPLPNGSVIGPYIVEGLLGGGGGGVVYAARHCLLGRRVAVKVLRAEMALHPVMVSRFVLEATAVTKIRHPGIVDIHEFGELAPGRPYYVMELLDGMNLSKFLQAHGRFSPPNMLALIEPVCDAVQAAHEAGIIHRDIKARNIVVVESDGKRVVKLLDFGIAKMSHPDQAGGGLTEPGAQLGTAHHMAPEQIRSEKLDARADIYALGVLIYQLLTGQFPFEGADPRHVALLHLHSPAPRPSALAPVSANLDAVVLRCLEKRPDQRFSTVAELASALRDAIDGAGNDTGVLVSSAVGVYVVVTAVDDGELDDEMLDDMSNVLDTVEQALAARGFAFPLRTSDALLGARLVSDEDGENELHNTRHFVTELDDALAERPDCHPALEVTIKSTVTQCQFRRSAGGLEVVGGSILDVDTWAADDGFA